MKRLVLTLALLASAAPGAPGAAVAAAPAAGLPGFDADAARAAALAAVEKARARAATLPDVARTVSLPSVERMIEDADLRRMQIVVPERDWPYVRRLLETARAYATRLAAGEDPYRGVTGSIVKAYRAEWDGSLQPYSLYVPRGYDAGKSWPLIVALHGAWSNHHHNLRRVFGLENRPGETDDEAARNELPLPDVPALVVSPEGRGAFAGYDGIGEEDVMRVLADARRAYNVDPDRITLTGLSMGGGGTWNIGLRHPELFAALAPVCGMTDARRMVRPEDAALYDERLLDLMSPLAIAENAANMQVFIFHGADDPTVPVADSRRMADRYRALGWLGKNVRYTEYPGVGHFAWVPAYKDADLLRTLAAIKRDPARGFAMKKQPTDQPVATLFSKSLPRQRAHIYVYGTHGPVEAVRAARHLAQSLADWGPGVAAYFPVKADSEVTAEDRARFNLVLVGAAPLNALAAGVASRELAADRTPLGDRAFRAIAPDGKAPSHVTLLFGALTPAGFGKLARFAGANRETPAPEPNRTFVMLP